MKILRFLLGLVLATALMTALGLASPTLTVSASAATSNKATYPQRGQTSVKVYELQQRLVKARALKSSYLTGGFGKATTAGVKGFQKSVRVKATGKVDAATWSALVKKTGAKPALIVKTLDRRCKIRGRAICVDKTTRKLYFVKNKTVVQIMDSRFGCASRTPTRQGLFHIQRKSRYHTSSIYHVYMPYAMFFSDGQAVHWSKAFLKNGYHGCSHGCVNIRDRAGIARLFDRVRVGDRVVIYRS